MSKQPTQQEIAKFRSYCQAFYSTEHYEPTRWNPEGLALYPIANNMRIDFAIDQYINVYLNDPKELGSWGGGDSLDRERVRTILQPDFETVQDCISK